jgi:transcription-repair coupling factor (superfamily II helicase)
LRGALSYAGGDKLYVPVENLEVLSRYGCEEGASLDRLGGEAWQRRKAKMKERIREIAGELIATAALRALRAGRCCPAGRSGYNAFVDRFPYEETDDQDRAIGDVLDDLAAGKPMDRLVCRRCRLRQDRDRAARRFRGGDGRAAGRDRLPDHAARAPAFQQFRGAHRGFPINIGRLSRLVPAAEAKRTKEGWRTARSTS